MNKGQKYTKEKEKKRKAKFSVSADNNLSSLNQSDSVLYMCPLLIFTGRVAIPKHSPKGKN